MKKNSIVIVAMLLLLGYGVFDYFKGKGDTGSIQMTEGDVAVGIQKEQRAPDFQLTDLTGNPVQLSDYRGKKVLVNFWATWCPPCKAEMPHMQRFYEDFSDDEVVVLGVNMTSIDKGMEAIEAFTKEYGLTFPIVLDQQGDVMDTYQITGYPTTYAIDQEGIIRAKFIGAIDYEMMKNTVNKM
ncbi:Thiol-disulfide oxidoreductase ResA [compost metagenome]